MNPYHSYLDFYYECTYVEDTNEIKVWVLNIAQLYEYLDRQGLDHPSTFADGVDLEPPCIHGGQPTKEQVLAYLKLGKTLNNAALQATRNVDSFRDRFIGYKRSSDQVLEWPRRHELIPFFIDDDDVYDPDNYYSLTVPPIIIYATAVTMTRIMAGENPFGNWVGGTENSNVQSVSYGRGAITKTFFDRGGDTPNNIDLEEYLTPVITSNITSATRTL